jgi:hypothetical protein
MTVLNKQDYFYNGTIRKVVSVFGSLFNSIYIRRDHEGGRSSSERVPLMYAPRNKLLERVEQRQQGPDSIAIRLPRMSFEMSSLTYDENSKLNRMNRIPVSGGTATIWNSVPYIIGMQLNVVSNSLEDVLQIVEQILPSFSPEYTVSIRDIEGPGRVTDVPIKISGVSPSDEYEGEVATRRIVLYTLDFEIKVRFAGAPISVKRIENIDINFFDRDDPFPFISNINIDSDGIVTITNDYDEKDFETANSP